MESLKKYLPSFASALLMCGILFLIWPHYRYYVDPDGTAYLTIAKRYASGDIQLAINGYWSPWACWLTAGLIMQGFEAILAGAIVNACGALGFLFISQSFFLRFDVAKRIQWLLNITLAIFLCFAVFWQSFDDLWECFFLLGTLRLMLAKDFLKKPALWVVCGIVGALAYFAKAYSFPFFILNTVVCTYILSKTPNTKFQIPNSHKSWITPSLVSIIVMVFCSHFWIVALHHKYGIWTTATAGSLNMSWYLVGHPIWKEGIKILLPPPYPDSPYYWEDPWFVNGPTPHFWSSWYLFGRQFLRIGQNILLFVLCSFQLSVFFIAIVGYAKWMVIWKRKALLTSEMRALMASLLLFTVGYLLVHYYSRYLWYMVPLSMVTGALYIQRMPDAPLKKILPYAFAISFLIWPAMRMAGMYDEGRQEAALAKVLQEKGIKGSFTSDAAPGTETQRMARLAYFSGNSFYVRPLPGNDWGNEFKKYNIEYFIVAANNENENNMSLRAPVDPQGKPYPCVLDEQTTGASANGRMRIKVFKLR